MNLRTRASRILRWTALSIAALVLLTAAAVQVQQHLLRWRAEQLMADMHQVCLYQSTWADAQRLMHRWGAWGHYDGSCSWADCTYKITLGDFGFGIREPERWPRFDHVLYVLQAHHVLGARMAALECTFKVHNGIIWRTSATVVIDVPPRGFHGNDEFNYSLIVRAKAAQHLYTASPEQLEEHPYYRVRRPGGCENCFMANITYSTYAPPELIQKLSTFNFSCFTRWKPCEFLGDLQPLAWQWKLYPGFEPGTTSLALPPAPLPCAAPVWAVARDRRHILSIIAGEPRSEVGSEGPMDWERLRIDEVLKGDSPFLSGTILDGLSEYEYGETREHMRLGQRYLVFFDDFGRNHSDRPVASIRLELCSVQSDTPEIRREVAKGIAMNDELPDKEYSW